MGKSFEEIGKEFRNRFGEGYILVSSPGRVNLIGEHTDYNDGFVLPAAIDRRIVLAMGSNGSDTCRMYALDKDEYVEADISGAVEKSETAWANYILGIVDQLRKNNCDVRGFDCVFGGDVPIGAGMSSSAALEGGALFGLAELFGLDISRTEMAEMAQKAENDFVGVQCGIMDQFVSLNGKAGNALKLDCRSLDYAFVPFDFEDIHIVMCDTQIRRELASSEYNVRRAQCQEGVRILKKHAPEITSLRDVELQTLMQYKDELDPTVFNRCKFVVEENKRVLQASRDLQRGDLNSFGQRMFQSHSGLQMEYEVSLPELDTLVDLARNIQGVIGARMMGGGFGGCTINLVQGQHLASFTDLIRKQYGEKHAKGIEIYKTKVSGGTQLIKQESPTA